MMFTDGTTLMSLLSPEDRQRSEEGLAARGILLSSVIKMKPWMLSAMVALPACEMARKAAGAPVLDVKLAEDAQGRRQEARRAGDRRRPVARDGVAADGVPSQGAGRHAEARRPHGRCRRDDDRPLHAGDTGMFWPLFRAVLPSDDEDKAGYAAFEQAMIVERNKTMIKSAEPIIDRRQRLHRGRRAASARPGRADRAAAQGRLHRHRRRRLRSSSFPKVCNFLLTLTSGSEIKLYSDTTCAEHRRNDDPVKWLDDREIGTPEQIVRLHDC